MSDLVAKVVRIEAVVPHPNADKLELVKIPGWQIVSGKGNYRQGDLAVHIQPETMIPRPQADAWGVTQYLSFGKSDDSKGRVKAAKLRGITSFGFLAPNELNAEEGTDLVEHFKLEKYDPPIPVGLQAGQMARNHPLFHKYTDIQNLRNFPDKLAYGEPMVVTEKIHGTNSRVGWVRTPDPENGGMSDYFEQVVGTHRTQRKVEDCGVYGLPFELHGEALHDLFDWAQKYVTEFESLIVFGEIYGVGVQDLHYGQKQEKGYRVFDVSINGKYLHWSSLAYLCGLVGLPLVPEISRGVFDFEQLLEMAEGNTILSDSHIREGIVVRPMVQELTWGEGTFDPNPKRMIFKVIGSEYLTRKGGTENH